MNWQESDRALLSTYISTTNGKLFEYLRSFLPKVTADNFEQAALQSRYKQGQEDMIEKIAQASQASQIYAKQEEFVAVDEGIV